MRQLTLIRHAKSSWNNAHLTDFERPLNDRGRRNAPVMADRVAKTLPPAGLLLSSPALRAANTARIFAQRLGVADEQIEFQHLIYEAQIDQLRAVARGLDDAHRHVIMFGHNPGFSEFLSWLVGSAPVDLPTCAVASLRLEIQSWPQLHAACGSLSEYLYPKDGS